MLNIIAAIIVFAAYFTFGIWNITRKWQYSNDLDAAFFWSLAPLAIATWIALYMVDA
jgi:hypothetical protein